MNYSLMAALMKWENNKVILIVKLIAGINLLFWD